MRRRGKIENGSGELLVFLGIVPIATSLAVVLILMVMIAARMAHVSASVVAASIVAVITALSLLLLYTSCRSAGSSCGPKNVSADREYGHP